MSSFRRSLSLILLAPTVLLFLFASAADAAGPAGSLIRYEVMPGAPDGAHAYRVLYWSTGFAGGPIEVSGVIIIPAGVAPPQGRPVLAWAHPTTGVVSRCAPSLAGVFFASVQGLREMPARGYVVAVTDYPGLGTPEVHPYLVGKSEATMALKRSFLRVDNLAERKPWRRLLEENSPGPLPPEIPVFLAQGSADGLVRPAVTETYRARLCQNGSNVEFVLLPGVGHAFVARDVANGAVAWIASRFADQPAPTNCGQ